LVTNTSAVIQSTVQGNEPTVLFYNPVLKCWNAVTNFV